MNVGTSNYYDSFWEFSQFKKYFNVPAVLYLNQNRKKQNHWIGRRRVETGNLWKYMLGKKCMVSDYNVSLKKSIELQDPLPKQLTILATQIPKSWTRRVEWNPDISLWNLAPPFSVSLRVKIYRLAGTQIFFSIFAGTVGTIQPVHLPAGKSHQKQPIFQSNFVTV